MNKQQLIEAGWQVRNLDVMGPNWVAIDPLGHDVAYGYSELQAWNVAIVFARANDALVDLRMRRDMELRELDAEMEALKAERQMEILRWYEENVARVRQRALEDARASEPPSA